MCREDEKMRQKKDRAPEPERWALLNANGIRWLRSPLTATRAAQYLLTLLAERPAIKLLFTCGQLTRQLAFA
jgi:hypothetical protein